MSAILPATPWNFPMGWPNCLRCPRVLHARLELALHGAQRRWPGCSSVPTSIDELKMAIPAPSGPSRFPAGTRQSCQHDLAHRRGPQAHLLQAAAHGEPRRPLVDEEGGDARPAWAGPGATAKTSTTSATGALVMYSLVPLRR